MQRIKRSLCLILAAFLMLPVFPCSAKDDPVTDLQLKDGILTISEAGTYRLTGTSNGQILIDAGKEDKITLILAGVSVTGTDSALAIVSAGKVILETEKGTENLLTTAAAEDTSALSEETDDAPEEDLPAAIHAKCDLTLKGKGTLTVEGGLKQGIRVTKDLNVKSGTVIVNAKATGIRVKDDCTVSGGTLAVTSGSDGFRIGTDATETEEAEGDMEFEGGQITVVSGGDAVQASRDIKFSGGELSAVTGGGRASANYDRSDDFGGFGWNWGWDADDDGDDTPSAKGLKAGANIEISGGILDLDCCDDALHCGQTVTVKGGSISLSSGDDGIHADQSVEISNGTVTVKESYEGIEGRLITISGGNVSVTADDDGFNANGDSGFGMGGSNSFGQPGPGGFGGNFGGFGGGNVQAPPDGNQPDGTHPQGNPPELPDGFRPDGNPPELPGGMQPGDDPGDMAPPEAEQTEGSFPTFTISGGNVYVNAQGDGLDSNGDILITGGYTVVDGPSDSMNSALDSGSENGGKLSVTGGTLLAIGAAGMAETFDETSTQVSFLVEARWQAGSTVQIIDAEGNELITHTAPRSGSSIVFTSPDLNTGETVTVKINDSETKVELTETTNGQGFGGFGGGFGGGGFGGGRGWW